MQLRVWFSIFGLQECRFKGIASCGFGHYVGVMVSELRRERERLGFVRGYLEPIALVVTNVCLCLCLYKDDINLNVHV